MKQNKINILSCFIITQRIINNVQKNTNDEIEKDEINKIIVANKSNNITETGFIKLCFNVIFNFINN